MVSSKSVAGSGIYVIWMIAHCFVYFILKGCGGKLQYVIWSKIMKVMQISDELYDRLKSCIADPFDDTPESVVGRLVDIVDKSKSRCSSWDAAGDTKQKDGPTTPSKSRSVRSGHDDIVL